MLANKTAVITGSTSGIGLGCARAFAEKGANVVINGLGDADEIEKTRAAIEADFGVRCTYSPANMLKGDEIAGMIADAEKEFGGVDILVNNAGIQFVSPVDEFPVDKWDAIIAINLTSAFHAIRAALPVRRLADAHNRGTARRFETIVCTTTYAAEEFARIGVDPAFVPLGVDLVRFCPDRRDSRLRDELGEPGEAVLLMASRLSAEKRPDLAVEAMRLLVARGRRVRLLSAGTGAIESRVRDEAAGLPIDFLGFVNGRTRFAALLATADAVVAPGPIETFGLAALEALASGTPVVVNAESALPEVVGEAGEVAAATPEAFADAIERVLERDGAARRRAARSRAEAFPWSATVDAMLALHGRARGGSVARGSRTDRAERAMTGGPAARARG